MCNCDIQTLMREGCKCGDLNKVAAPSLEDNKSKWQEIPSFLSKLKTGDRFKFPLNVIVTEFTFIVPHSEIRLLDDNSTVLQYVYFGVNNFTNNSLTLFGSPIDKEVIKLVPERIKI